MKRKTILAYDDLDCRKELWRLLGDSRLGCRGRLSFVQWCAAWVNDKEVRSGRSMVKVTPVLKDGKYLTSEAISDLSMLTIQYHGDVDVFLAELTRRVRRL